MYDDLHLSKKSLSFPSGSFLAFCTACSAKRLACSIISPSSLEPLLPPGPFCRPPALELPSSLLSFLSSLALSLTDDKPFATSLSDLAEFAAAFAASLSPRLAASLASLAISLACLAFSAASLAASFADFEPFLLAFSLASLAASSASLA